MYRYEIHTWITPCALLLIGTTFLLFSTACTYATEGIARWTSSSKQTYTTALLAEDLIRRPTRVALRITLETFREKNSQTGLILRDVNGAVCRIQIFPRTHQVLMQWISPEGKIDLTVIRQQPERILLGEGKPFTPHAAPMDLHLNLLKDGVDLNLGQFGCKPTYLLARCDKPLQGTVTLQAFSQHAKATYSQIQISTPPSIESNAHIVPSPIGKQCPSWSEFAGTHYHLRPEMKLYRDVIRLRKSVEPLNTDKPQKGNIVTGPYTGESYVLKPLKFDTVGWLRKHKARTVELLNGPFKDTTIPTLYEIQQHKDILYWAVRRVYEGHQPQDVPILWELGNEINAHHVTWINTMSLCRRYIEWGFAPAAEAIRQVSQDLYDEPDRIQLMSGDVANTSTADTQSWMRRMLTDPILGDTAPTLAGKRIIDLVDYVGVHYIVKGPFWRQYMNYLYNDYVKTGLIKGIWSTEEMGGGGARDSGTYGLAVPFRLMDWWSRHNWQTGAGGCIFWGDWWGMQTYPTVFEIEKTLDSILGTRKLINLTDTSIARSSKEVEVYTFITKEEQPRIATAIIPACYSFHPHEPKPMGSTTINMLSLNLSALNQSLPQDWQVLVKRIDAREVNTVVSKNFSIDHKQLQIPIEVDLDHEQYQMLLILAAPADSDCMKQLRKTIARVKRNILTKAGEVVLFDFANAAALGPDSKDMGFARAKHALIAHNWNKGNVSYDMKLKRDYSNQKALAIHVKVLSGKGRLALDGKQIPFDFSKKTPRYILKDELLKQFTAGEHQLTLDRTAGFACIIASLSIEPTTP